MPETLVLFERAAVALAVGLLIGLERGWKTRELGEGQRVAGVRTFGAIGLLGGLAAFLTLVTEALTLAAVTLGMAGLVSLNYWFRLQRGEDLGSTTVVAALSTFVLGALAGFGEQAIAGAAAVGLAVLLGAKQELHGFVARIEWKELRAILQFLVISVILLPILPNEAFGPFDAFNPYRIWWMVVLISGLSGLGYAAVKIVGPERGIMLTGLLGGLASSTVTTINLSRLGRGAQSEAAAQPLLASAVVAATATMYPRILIVVAVVAPGLLPVLAWPLLLAAASVLIAVGWRFKHGMTPEHPESLQPRNPFDLRFVLLFAVLLTVVMVVARGLQTWVGEGGLYTLAAVAGLSDVDAITLSLSTMATDGTVGMVTAATGIVIVAAVNTLVKPVFVLAIAGWRMAAHTLIPFAIGLAGGGVGLYVARGLA